MSLGAAEGKTPRRVPDRFERIILATTGFGAVVCATVAFWPVRDHQEEYRRLGETERRAIAAWQAIVADVRTRGISEAEVAGRIEREVLPAWREAVRQVNGLPEEVPGVPAGMPEVFRMRQEAWEAMVAAGRSDDPDLSREAGRKWALANDAVARLRVESAPRAE